MSDSHAYQWVQDIVTKHNEALDAAEAQLAAVTKERDALKHRLSLPHAGYCVREGCFHSWWHQHDEDQQRCLTEGCACSEYLDPSAVQADNASLRETLRAIDRRAGAGLNGLGKRVYDSECEKEICILAQAALKDRP